MKPKKSGSTVPDKAPSPMQKIERALGPNETGHDDQAQAAHRVEVAAPNIPPSEKE
jgi:hypothetical protein